MFGGFFKKTPLTKLLQEFDGIGPDYLGSAITSYGGGKAGDVYSALLKLDDISIFAETEALLPAANVQRRCQLYFVMWLIACRLDSTPLKQKMLWLYYNEPDDHPRKYICDLVVRDSLSDINAPPPFNILSPALDLQPPASAQERGEFYYLDLLTKYLSLHWHNVTQGKAAHIDMYDMTDRILRMAISADSKNYPGFPQPEILAKLGGYCSHPDVRNYLLEKLGEATQADEKLRLAAALAENFPQQIDDRVKITLLDLSAKRQTRYDAVRALAHVPSPEVEDRLMTFLQDDKTGIDFLCCVLRSLGAIKSIKARPLIATFLGHAKRDVRWAALAALPVEGEWVSCWVTRLNKDKDPFLKGFALTGLLGNKSSEVKEAVFAFTRKAAKVTASQQLSVQTFIHHATAYLAGFPEDQEIQNFLKSLPPEYLTGTPAPEACLTAGLH